MFTTLLRRGNQRYSEISLKPESWKVMGQEYKPTHLLTLLNWALGQTAWGGWWHRGHHTRKNGETWEKITLYRYVCMCVSVCVFVRKGVHMYIHVCLCSAHMCTCPHACIWYRWRHEVDLGYPPSSLRISCWTQSSPIPAGLASHLAQGSPVSDPCHACSAVRWVLGFKPQSPHSSSKCYIYWAVSPAPTIFKSNNTEEGTFILYAIVRHRKSDYCKP